VIKKTDARAGRLRRARRVRARIPVSAERPRLSVHRSAEHIYAQVIDDLGHRTLASASTLDPDLRPLLAGLKKTQRAEKVGEAVARRALDGGVTKVAFDRGSFGYHGRIQALADAARKAGLSF
jgi:large subunit ribosomal protein L18